LSQTKTVRGCLCLSSDDGKLAKPAARLRSAGNTLWPWRSERPALVELGADMTVHVVIREDQNEHGFVDTSVVGLFRRRNEAEAFVASSISAARDEGLRVYGDLGVEPDWEVSWMIEPHPVS
jgi:hypothetical protein